MPTMDGYVQPCPFGFRVRVGGIAVLIYPVRNHLVGMTFADSTQRHPTHGGISHGDSREGDMLRYRYDNATSSMLYLATTKALAFFALLASARVPSAATTSFALPASAPRQRHCSCRGTTSQSRGAFPRGTRPPRRRRPADSNIIIRFVITILYLNRF
jgi:hypothetical protein